MSAEYHPVHVRVNDATTGQPTPARVRFFTPQGEYLAPFGRLTEFTTAAGLDVGGNLCLEQKRYAYVDGTFEISLPVGPVHVEISKGPEYLPLREVIHLGPGQASLRLNLERWTDWRREGWYSGDSRVHHLSPHAALLEGAAEDVAVVNLLAAEYEVLDPGTRLLPRSLAVLEPRHDPARRPAISNLLAFSGQRPALEVPGHLVVVNTHNTHPVLGRLALLNCHRVVYPLSFGGPGQPDNWTLSDWCGQCHRKGGLVVWTGAWREGEHDEDPSGSGEALADLILGRIDAIELADFCCASDDPRGFESDEPLYPWYRLLNCGFHVPLVGASAKAGNGAALGRTRTYARLLPGEELSYARWIESVRAGRTFVTEGPLLSLTVDGRDPGAVIDLPPTGGTVRVRAEARGVESFAALEVVANGECVAGSEAAGSPCSAVVETDVRVAASGWLAARCGGLLDVLPGERPATHMDAHTSPVYVQVEGRPLPGDAGDVAPLLDELDSIVEWVEQQGRFENERRREHLAGIFREARQELVRRQSG